jgi:hypothetical protein
MSDGRTRCSWADFSGDRWATDDSVLYRNYHDTEWGQPLRGDRELFERMTLEAFQSGLSWLIILRKRDNFRRAFQRFEADDIARFGDGDVERLMADAGLLVLVSFISPFRAERRMARHRHHPGAIQSPPWKLRQRTASTLVAGGKCCCRSGRPRQHPRHWGRRPLRPARQGPSR